MADNVQLSTNVGTGEVCATDDVSGVQYQVIKLADGTADSATRIVAGGGVEANALRVTIASDSTGVVSVDDNGASLTIDAASLPLPTGASTAAKQPALGTAGTASADVVTVQGVASMTPLLVNGSGVTQPVSAASLPLPSGAATAANQTSVIAGLASIDSHVDGVETLLGSIDGKITAVNTGAVVVSSSALPTGASTAANQATGNASLATLAGVVSGTEAQVDIVAALPAGTNNIGDVDVLTLPALAAGSAIIGNVRIDQTTPGTTNGVQVNAALPAGTNAIGKLAANSGVDIGDVDVTTLPAITIAAAQTLATVTTVGTVTAITNALPAGTNAIGKLAANSGIDIGDVDVTSIAAGSNLIGDVSLQPRTTGGLTMSKTTSAASTNATSLKASAGQVYAVQIFNVNAAVRYLKLYNKASAPTVGTDVPVKTLAIPGNTAGAGMVLSWPQGIAFGTGIAFALTTEATDAGTTGVAANEITVNIDYK